MSRVVCWFSCGAASAVATKLALRQFEGREIVIARCVIDEEHLDNDLFAEDCAKWFGHPITDIYSEEHGSSIVSVFNKSKGMSFPHGAPCTRLLKKGVRLEFERPTDKHVFGYTAEEQARWDSFLDANNIDAVAPLIERGLEHADCLSMIETAGIELPVMYKLGYEHNNCIGCVKASGAGYWNKIRKDFPVVFAERAEQSRRLGCRLIRIDGERVFLDELPEGVGRYEDEPKIQCGIFCEMANAEIGAA